MIDKAIRLAGLALLSVLTVAAVIIGLDVHQAVQDVDASLQQERVWADEMRNDLHGDQLQVAALIESAQGAADQATMFALEQRGQLKKTQADGDKTVKALRVVIDRAGLLMKHADEELATNSTKAGAAIDGVNLAVSSLRGAADSLQQRAADPQIPELLGRWNVISGNFESMSANGVKMSGDMQSAVHRLAAPPSRFHQAVDVGYTALKFGSLFIP